MEPSEVSARLRAIASVIESSGSPSLWEAQYALRGVLAAFDDGYPRSKRVPPPRAMPGGDGFDPSGGNLPPRPGLTVPRSPYIPKPDEVKPEKPGKEYVPPAGRMDPRQEREEKARRDGELKRIEEARRRKLEQERLPGSKEREENARRELQKERHVEREKAVSAAPEYFNFKSFIEFLDGFDRDAVEPQEKLKFCRVNDVDPKQFDSVMEAAGKHVIKALPGEPIRAPKPVLEKAADELGVSPDDVRKFLRSFDGGGELVDSKAISEAMTEWLAS